MKVLIACERSGITREMFSLAGCEAHSCDLEQSEIRSIYHHKQDILQHLKEWNDYDMMIAYPPCTHLCVSGARWFKQKEKEQKEALDFIKQLMDANIRKICIENPIGIISTKIRKPDQIIQPYQFGHGETKATCLWLQNLPLLQPTWEVKYPSNRVHKMPPGEVRAFERSRTYIGIAFAMAQQWAHGKVILKNQPLTNKAKGMV